MKNFSFKFLFPLITLVFLIYLLDTRVFEIPALGKFFNPHSGIIRNQVSGKSSQHFTFPGREIEIVFDEREVPHVFAKNQDDLLFAQGFVTASDRLWQMDFISYVSAGRLSEILGRNYLDYDRMQRRTGMLESAKKTLKYIESNPETKKALDNYTQGVNAYLAQLQKADLPFEYKLMDYTPESWTNLKSVLIMKYVGSTLTGYEEDVNSSYMKMALGKDYDVLYPDYKLSNESDKITIQRLFDSLPYQDYINYSFLGKAPVVNGSQFNPRLGSNAWAVSDEKSAGDGPILCNDPHLNLSLPSIWYELQLHSDEMNVYGYSIPGTPGIIIGFNEHISWGVTNGASDVRDWYKLELKEDYSEYRMDGKWLKTKAVIEQIKIRDYTPFYDTVYHTMHGPIVVDGSMEQMPEVMNCALRWSLHDKSNEFFAVLSLNKAKNYTEFQDAISHFRFPGQNFIYADRKGNIARNHQGTIWKRDQRYFGKFIYDGSRKDHLTRSVLKQSELPKEFNPESGFVYSANNNPFSSQASKYVNGYYAELRANKIQSVLSQNRTFSIKDLQQLQGDNTNRLAELAMPVLLKMVKHKDKKFLHQLKQWDCSYDKDDQLATFFEDWWGQIEYGTWDELVRYSRFIKNPDDVILLELIQQDSKNTYFDVLSTTEKEEASVIVNRAFEDAYAYYHSKQKQGWAAKRPVKMVHLSNSDALSIDNLQTGGHPEALNAFSTNWGPSIRMVVQMGKEIKAYGIYAGGQSGNPASEKYDRFVKDWLNVRYYRLHLYLNSKQAKTNHKTIWKFNG